MPKKVLKIGHRGANGYCLGNTLACFEKSIRLGVDMIELDVHLKDGKLFVIHSIKDLSRRTPVLKNVFDLVKKRVKIDIELKGRGAAEPVAKLIKEYIKKGWKESDFLVSSFRVKELKNFKKQGLKVKMVFIARKKRKIIKDPDFYYINIALKIAKKKLINKLHNQGFKIFVWTANKKKDIKRLMSFGIDGIISDYPDKL